MFILITQKLVLDFFLDLLYFPLWWYTGGVKFMALKCLGLLKSGNDFLAPGLWLRNIMVPMFAQWDLEGRIISFFMRLVQVIARSFALCVWLIFVTFLFFIWLIIPVVIVQNLFNFGN